MLSNVNFDSSDHIIASVHDTWRRKSGWRWQRPS
jgi:hypothetical protein